MGLLSNIVSDAQDVQASEEYVATGSKKITESGNVLCKIIMAKEKQSAGGAIGIDLQLETEDGKNLYDTLWVTTKAGQPYYIDREGNKRELLGFNQASGLNFLINGVWGMPSSEPKEIKEYSYDKKKEEFVTRDVVTSWIGKGIGVSAQVTMEDHWEDSTKSLTRVSAKHFWDPVTHLFSSEKKKGNTEPEMYGKFAEVAEKDPVLDKRDMSKNEVGGNNAIPKENLAF